MAKLNLKTSSNPKNMRKLLFFTVFSACITMTLAQQIAPRFQMTLYFHDAIGHQDSVVVGYDETASFNILNPQFGEQAITTPFDSVFEVRATHADDNTYITSKKIIENYELGIGDTCGASAGVNVFIRCKYPPVTIYYDTALVNSSFCHRNMILSPDWLIFLLPYWWDAREYYCMSHTDKVVSDLYRSPGDGSWLSHPFEVEGQGVDSIPGFFWIVKYIGICQNQVATQSPVSIASGLSLSPNPTDDRVSLRWPAPFTGRVWVQGIAGGQLLEQSIEGVSVTELSLGRWPVGMYLLTTLDKAGRRETRKVTRY